MADVKLTSLKSALNEKDADLLMPFLKEYASAVTRLVLTWLAEGKALDDLLSNPPDHYTAIERIAHLANFNPGLSRDEIIAMGAHAVMLYIHEGAVNNPEEAFNAGD